MKLGAKVIAPGLIDKAPRSSDYPTVQNTVSERAVLAGVSAYYVSGGEGASPPLPVKRCNLSIFMTLEA
jgi:hypothetical protein